MRAVKSIALFVALMSMCFFICIGYAAVSDRLTVSGNAQLNPPSPDVYITSVSPKTSAGVTVSNTNGTVMFAKVTGLGTATFTVNFVNISDKTYVFDRVIDGTEIQIEGAYSGKDIIYTVSGISQLDEIAPNGGTRSLTIEITVPRGVTADLYVLNFAFVEKSGTEILPGYDEHAITFHYNNGEPNKTIMVHQNDFIPRPELPTRNGYTFTGWYTDSACTSAWNFEIDRVAGPTSLYAGWQINPDTQHVVTFSPGNGESSRVILVKANTLIPLQEPPTWEGYTFIGWYRDRECTVPWNFDTDKVTSSMILYGGWEVYVPPVPPDCNITFKPGNKDPDTTIIVLTGEFIPRPQTPIREGYVFTGWYTDEACTSAWNFEVNKVEHHTTLYGGWELAPIIETKTYTITFKPGNGAADTTVTVEEGNHIPRPPLPTREGYTFIGWYTDSALTHGWNFDTDVPTSNLTLYGGWEKAPTTSDEAHGDFLGLVEALLSESNNCLNHSDVIFNAVMESLTSKKRPKEDAPILHCSVNSVSGGTMSAIASFANANLTDDLHFIFEVDPDPAYQSSRMRLYMYYEKDIDAAKTGDVITVYQQIVRRGSDDVWYADGTYIGVATVGNFFGGGNAGKDVKTINPYTWHSTVTTAE